MFLKPQKYRPLQCLGRRIDNHFYILSTSISFTVLRSLTVFCCRIYELLSSVGYLDQLVEILYLLVSKAHQKSLLYFLLPSIIIFPASFTSAFVILWYLLF